MKVEAENANSKSNCSSRRLSAAWNFDATCSALMLILSLNSRYSPCPAANEIKKFYLKKRRIDLPSFRDIFIEIFYCPKWQTKKKRARSQWVDECSL